ncbi:hypothetical protein LAZ67_22001558 [Cordylochernes scorpioides]|uniref:Integrase catalytic domain-containing protein n=1 Tax=Cordylochernes scorpioides TaxID=51811 RepID=A0ABY6LSZ4_9ARAC|nr:hypothetical protein LAZ67_22001558 [Cordylochernes scorpioides]
MQTVILLGLTHLYDKPMTFDIKGEANEMTHPLNVCAQLHGQMLYSTPGSGGPRDASSLEAPFRQRKTLALVSFIAQIRIISTVIKENHIYVIKKEDLYCKLCGGQITDEIYHFTAECGDLEDSGKIGICIPRKRINLSPSQAFFLLVLSRGRYSMATPTFTIGELYHSHQDDDGFLYFTYTSHEVFGASEYTSWMEVVPLPDMKSETVARAFYENWIVRFGAPHTVISDQGKQFTSQLFKDLTTLCGIKLRHSTAYHPQFNGKIERLHRTIKTAIRAHNNIKWIETLPTVLLGLRAAINKDNNHSLSQMVYGKTIRLPGEFFDESKHHLHAEEFVQQLQKQMELLKPMNEKHHSKTKVFVHKDLKTCSHVFIRTDRVKKPLKPPYEGPFPVLDRTDKYFTLKVKGINVTISIDRLRPAYLLADSDNLTSEHSTATRPIVSGALSSTSSQQNPDPPDVEKYTEFQGTGSAPDLTRTRSGRK